MNTALGVTNARDMRDALLAASVTLPNAAETKTTAGLDLANVTVGRGAMDMDLVVTTTLATGVTAKTHVITIQDSADNVTFAAIAGLGTYTHTSASNLYAAASHRIRLPIVTRRYVRASVLGETGGGNASDGILEISLRA